MRRSSLAKRALAVLCWSAAVVSGGATAGEVKALRVWGGPDYTRAVFDVSGPHQYKLFSLQNPDRLVLDIEGASLAAAFKAGETNGLLAGVRTGKQGPKDLRVVFDLKEGAKPKSFLLPPAEKLGYRLVVDLYPNAKAPVTPVVRTVETALLGSAALLGSDRDVIIAVDAGHGGEDPGARGASGSWEKNITLAVARELAAQIDAEPGFKSYLVRDGDYFIPLEKRYQKARDARADLFVSIHADAFHKATASGSSVFVLSTRGASGEAARWLADRENASDLVGGVSLDDKDNTLARVLLDLSQSATMKASDDVANHVLDAMKRVGKTHKPHVERANFVVLRSPDVPSLLVETAFISNPGEEKNLLNPTHRSKLASAIVEGARDYFSNQPPPGTWLASNATARPRQHVVGPGETLSLIASRHGISLSSLRAANGLHGDMVRVGARLKIPATVGPG